MMASAAPSTILVQAVPLRAFAAAILEAVGMTAEDASLAADAMAWADLRGLEAHGVGTKLPQCVARIRAGGTDPRARLVPLGSRAAVAAFDGDTGWGQVAASRGMRHAIGLARESGIGVVSICNVSSAAAMGHYAWLAAEARMIGLAVTNGPALTAPWGGTRRVLGNQAHAIACSAGPYAPLVFDSATTLMSTGEMDTLRERGELLPEGVLFDAGGRPTRDPAAWLTGLLVPAGGHRGYGLALMLEVLTGVIAGGELFAPNVGQPMDSGTPQGVSLFLIAIDPRISMPIETFESRVRHLIDQVHASPPAPGVARVFVPGERSAETAERRRLDGIPIPLAKVEAIRELGRSVGVDWPEGATVGDH
ncbi:MAG TPA: Ldh family oxidoreductase [Candidatus Limnocylindrales bacterium]